MQKINVNIEYAKGRKSKGYVLDVSRSGIGIACSTRIRKNTFVRIAGRPRLLVALEGRVAHCGTIKRTAYGYQIGVVFEPLNSKQKASLDKFFSVLEKRSHCRLGLK